MEEKRHADRRRALKTGRLVFNNGQSTIDCTIRNISEDGALLRIASPLGLPEHFDLLTVSDGVRKPCRLVRREGDQIAVAFTGGDTVPGRRPGASS